MCGLALYHGVAIVIMGRDEQCKIVKGDGFLAVKFKGFSLE